MLYSYQGKTPELGRDVFVAEGARIIGDVQIGEQSSIWFNSVIRGDLASITIGKRSNIQDLSVIHVDRNKPVVIEDDVTVGHSVILHGCTVKKGTLVGMGAIILSGAVIGEESLVAAGALVTANKVFPPRVLLMGSPAKVVRELTEEEILANRAAAGRYVEKGQEHRENVPVPLPSSGE